MYPGNGPGATIHISERGTRGTVVIPGISYTENLSNPRATPEHDAANQGMSFARLLGWGLAAPFVVALTSRLMKS